MPVNRVHLLCEDRRTERFLRRLCARADIRVLKVLPMPDGNGSGAAWVSQQYLSTVRELRARRDQQGLGLIVGIDGDDRGLAARQRELESELAVARLPPRDDDERIAIFVPTWSIETWLVHLSGRGDPGEVRPLKTAAEYRELWKDGRREDQTLATAVKAWRGTASPPPSLAVAYTEAARVGL